MIAIQTAPETFADLPSGSVAHSQSSQHDVAVSLRDLTKDYGAVRAVDDLNLEIQRGETVALLGPNGAGKTTTVSMLLGLLAPTRGAVSILGMPPRAAIAGTRIGAMLQDGSLMPGVRVGELLDFALRVGKSSISRAQLLASAGLTDLASRRVEFLSGGQTQRLRFALAVASDPEVLVLDEPTAAMDVESRHDFWARMRDYASSGRTILFATHYLEEAEMFASRVVIIARGRIIADGTVTDLKQRFGVRTVSFRLDPDATRGAELDRVIVAQLSSVCGVEATEERFTLQTTDSDATVHALTTSGLPWHDLEVRSATLEDVFLKLVDGN